MKKCNFLIYISIVSLALSGCGNKNKATSYKEQIYSDVPGTKKDAAVSFNNISNTVMIDESSKEYVDKMKEQELTLEYPYRLSSLYGPEDYTKMANLEPKNNKDYTEEEKGGVDVCELLKGPYPESVPISISWSKGKLDYKRAKIRFWPTTDKSDIREVEADKGLTSATLPNLYRNSKYTFQLIADSETTRYTSQEVKFTTADYPRIIDMGDVKNVRDLGGYMTSYGVKTNQGLIYRGYEIEDAKGGNGVNYNEKCQKVQDEVLHIGHELDLRADSGANERKKSSLSTSDNPVDYTRATVIAYDSFINDETSTKNLKTIFDIFANADKKHVYFHGWTGADRTGMVSFFLNAILGVSYTDLIIDYELSSGVNNPRCHMHNSAVAHFPKFIDAFTKYEGFDENKTINQNCEKFLIDKGVKEETIQKIRSIMIPGYKNSMKEKEPTYKAVGEYLYDDMAHWKAAKGKENVKCDYHRHTFVFSQNQSNTNENEERYVCEVCKHEKVIHKDTK